MTDIKNFLNTMLEAEQNRYLLKKLIDELNSKLSNFRLLPTPVKPTRPDEAHVKNDLEILDIISFTVFGSTLGVITSAVLGTLIGTKPWFLLIIGTGAVLGLITPIICSIKSVSEQKERVNKHNEECYKMKLKNYEYKVNLNKTIIEEYNATKEIYYVQIKALENKLAETDAVIKKLYSTGVCYQKYCNITAVATIAEYLNSGRCNTLEDAYKLYEDEVHKNYIISDISKVKDSLHRIVANQYLLYQVIKDANNESYEISFKVESYAKILIDSNAQDIKVYSGISKLISEITKDELDYMDKFN